MGQEVPSRLLSGQGWNPVPAPVKVLPVNSTSIESPVERESVDIPTCYAPFSNVFCPQRASQLPLHRPWDCTIDLILAEPVPHRKIYPLSLPEHKAMEEYAEEALQQGYIHPSKSSAASSFFSVAQNDGGIRTTSSGYVRGASGRLPS